MYTGKHGISSVPVYTHLYMFFFVYRSFLLCIYHHGHLSAPPWNICRQHALPRPTALTLIIFLKQNTTFSSHTIIIINIICITYQSSITQFLDHTITHRHFHIHHQNTHHPQLPLVNRIYL